MNAKWEREITGVSTRAGSLEEILYPSEFITDGIFVTKRGHVAGVLRVEPASFEVMDPSAQRLLCERTEAALRALDPGIRVYQYLIKTGIAQLAGRSINDPKLEVVSLAQRQHLEHSRGPLYQIDTYWALVYESVTRNNFWDWFYFPKSGAIAIDAAIQGAAGILGVYLDGLSSAMRGAVDFEILTAEKTFGFLRRLLNYGPEHRGLHLAEPWNLDVQLTRSKIDVRSSLTVGRSHVRVLTLEHPPRRSTPNLWKGLLDIPCEFIIVTEWKPLPIAKTQKMIHDMKVHFVNQLKGIRSVISEATVTKDRQLHEDEVIIDGSKSGLLKDLKEAQEAISRKGLYFGDYGMTFVLHSEDVDQLRAGVSAVLNNVHPHGAQISEGMAQTALASWLAIVPGHERLNVRRLKMDNVSIANMSFLFGPPGGQERNTFLDDEYLSVWLTRRKTPYYFNLHKGQVGHGIMTGASGSGKSYALTSLILDSQKYDPYTVIFDVTGAFRALTAELGGSYLELGRHKNVGCAAINPFSLSPTPANISYLTSLVRMLIESDGGSTLSAAEIEDTYKQVRSLMTTGLPSGERRLGNLHPAPHLASRLARWIRDGQHAWLFDNPEDTLTFSQFQAFSFPNIATGEREVTEALLYYILHRTLEAIYETDRPAFVWMDEAINFLKHRTMRQYIESALLNWRKQRASLFIVVHSLTDIPKETAVMLAERCPSRIHLSNPGIDTRQWRDLLHISGTEADTIRKLVPAREMLVEGAGVMSLEAAPQLHELLATGFEKKTA